MLATALGGFVVTWYALRAQTWKKLSLHSSIDSTVEGVDESVKVGDCGICLGRLSPMGKVKIGEVVVEALSQSGYIDSRAEVEVVKVYKDKVIVKLKKEKMDNTGVVLLVAAIAGSVFLLWVILYFIPIGLWFQALVSDVKISLLQLILMRWRKVPPTIIVGAMIEGKKAGIELYRDLLEAHYLAGGHVAQVVHALVSASKANIDLTFQIATAVDLAGRDVFEAVQMSVNPKVINTPPVSAVAKDGIQLIAKARVTVRANIKRLVGGAGEETILARVGEGIVSSIGSSDSHKAVMENPDFISKVVLDKGLDSGTAFEILSIDIADIDVGKNIGAGLQIDQADADLKIAQAKAEERRAMAIAREQEMKALAQEMKAKVIEAEAHVPLAMAEAFRSGNLGVMDYYRMKNIEADTQMRETIAKPEDKKKRTDKLV